MRKATRQAGSHPQDEANDPGIAAPGALSSRFPVRQADINVLLVAADPEDARAVGNVLAGERGASFQLHWVTRLPEDLRSLGLGETTVVLLDLLVGDVAGIGALDTLLKTAPHVPVLVFSDVGDEDLARQAVQRGAQDYLPRNRIDAYSLPRALRNAIDRKTAADALFVERERAQVTLDSIGDAVLSTDMAGKVAYVNSVAEKMTGWPREEALGLPLGEVLRILDATTGLPGGPSPMKVAIEKDGPATLVANSVLVRRDGLEIPIEDSAAPIHSRDGSTIGAVMVFRDVGKARALALELSHRAQHDFLTDLPNPVLLDDRIAQAIALAQRNRRQLAVLFVDLDHFKLINDSLGHAAGDKLLQSVALRLRACVRGSDTVSRKGGDEFVVLLSDIAHPDDAARAADKVLAAVAAMPRIAGPHVLTTSVGIAVYPSDGEDAPTLLRNADQAMYRAKDAGRNRRYFSSSDAP